MNDSMDKDPRIFGMGQFLTQSHRWRCWFIQLVYHPVQATVEGID